MFKQRCPHPYHAAKKRARLEKCLPLVVLALLLLAFLAGRFSLRGAIALEVELDQLRQTLDSVKQENISLQKQYDFIQSGLKVDKLALDDMRQLLKKRFTETSDLKERVAFYEGIVSPESLVKGLYLHDVEIKPAEGADTFQYQLVLAQNNKKRSIMKGTVTLLAVGTLNGKSLSLQMASFTELKKNALAFSFRYYQLLSGVISFPSGFVPRQLKVEVYSSVKAARSFEKEFEWRGLIEASRL